MGLSSAQMLRMMSISVFSVVYFNKDVAQERAAQQMRV
jgi:hypothetical protein